MEAADCSARAARDRARSREFSEASRSRSTSSLWWPTRSATASATRPSSSGGRTPKSSRVQDRSPSRARSASSATRTRGRTSRRTRTPTTAAMRRNPPRAAGKIFRVSRSASPRMVLMGTTTQRDQAEPVSPRGRGTLTLKASSPRPREYSTARYSRPSRIAFRSVSSPGIAPLPASARLRPMRSARWLKTMVPSAASREARPVPRTRTARTRSCTDLRSRSTPTTPRGFPSRSTGAERDTTSTESATTPGVAETGRGGRRRVSRSPGGAGPGRPAPGGGLWASFSRIPNPSVTAPSVLSNMGSYRSSPRAGKVPGS